MLLAVVMTVSLVCIPASADNGSWKDQYNKGTGYLAFGDSWTHGYGASDQWDNEGYNMDSPDGEIVYTEKGKTVGSVYCRNVTGSYPWLVAKGLGLESNNDITDKNAKYWPLAVDAVSTSYILDLLGIDDGFYDYNNLYSYNLGRSRYNTMLKYFGDKDVSFNIDGETRYDKAAEVYSVRELVSESPLITIAIGMGDTFNKARASCVEGLDLSKSEDIVTALERFVKLMGEGFDYWQKNYPKILDYFKRYAPEDGKVVIVGCFNPAANMNISDEYPVPVGSALALYTNLMNKQYREWAEEYGYIFVDVSNVDTGAVVDDVSIIDLLTASDVRYQGLATHPSPTGYRQIANAILYALEQDALEDQANKNTIRVDLGRIKNVKYVTVDNKIVNNYTIDENGILTVPRANGNAENLSVGAVSESGKFVVAVYTLSYDNDHGYNAFRAYTTNDGGNVLKSFGLIISGIAKTIYSKLFK